MIKLEKIKEENGIITCEAFVEGCKTPIILSYNREKDELQPYTLPNGYSYCHRHIAHAVNYFRRTLSLPERKTIMWG